MRQSEKNRIDRINKLHATTRWLPDSAFTTFFGKPAFHAYGKGNVNPTYGGPIYGQYMLSHNINPECGSNLPQYRQTYKCAGMKTFDKPDRVPHLPRKCAEDARMTDNMVADVNKRNPRMPEAPLAHKQRIVAPDLARSGYFHSEHGGTPPPSEPSDTASEAPAFQKAERAKPVTSARPKKAETLKPVEAPKKKAKKAKIVEFEQAEPDMVAVEVEEPIVTRKTKKRKSRARKVEPEQAQEEASPSPEPSPEASAADIEEEDVQSEEESETQDGQDAEPFGIRYIDGTAYIPFCPPSETPGDVPLHELDPRNYKFVPSQWTKRIRAAGRNTHKSEALYNVIMGGDDEE